MPENDQPRYRDPLVGRYASAEMARVFAEETRFILWRQLWVALAEAERELGLPIDESQIADLRANIENLNLERARQIEREVRHDVMSHVRAYAEQCPSAGGVIHLGATSCFVTDNSELWQIREGLRLVRARLVAVIRVLREFAGTWKKQPTLGFTHYQPAQLTTVGKRATLWLHDFVEDLREVEYRLGRLAFRGVKGTTGRRQAFWRSSMAITKGETA